MISCNRDSVHGPRDEKKKVGLIDGRGKAPFLVLRARVRGISQVCRFGSWLLTRVCANCALMLCERFCK